MMIPISIYIYSGYSIGFDTSRSSLLSDVSVFDKNVMVFRGDMSSSVHINNKRRYLDSSQRFNAKVRRYHYHCRERIFYKLY